MSEVQGIDVPRLFMRMGLVMFWSQVAICALMQWIAEDNNEEYAAARMLEDPLFWPPETRGW